MWKSRFNKKYFNYFKVEKVEFLTFTIVGDVINKLIKYETSYSVASRVDLTRNTKMKVQESLGLF